MYIYTFFFLVCVCAFKDSVTSGENEYEKLVILKSRVATKNSHQQNTHQLPKHSSAVQVFSHVYLSCSISTHITSNIHSVPRCLFKVLIKFLI